MPPDFGEFPDPVARAGEVVGEVTAAGIHHFDLAKLAGKLPGGGMSLPFVAGSDGIAHLGDGQRVFFDQPVAPHGTWAERALMRPDCLMVPAEQVDDITARRWVIPAWRHGWR